MADLKKLEDLTPDPKNLNKGTQRGRALLEKSLRQLGAGRSVLVDKDGNIIAGNKTVEVAAELGLPIKVVETDGKHLVVVKRKDLGLTDKTARELSIADNRVGELDLDWDAAMFQELPADIDLTEWFTDGELRILDAGTDDLDRFSKPDIDSQIPEGLVPEKPAGDSNWFYVEFYGKNELYRELQELLAPFRKSEHEILGEKFAEIILRAAKEGWFDDSQTSQ